MKDHISLFKHISIDTWERLKFANKTNYSLSETTITENILFEINKYRISNNDNSIKIFEAKDEAKNGNDLEIYLEVEDDKYILLLIQAKKLYINEEKYTQISHKVNKKLQIDLLQDYAKSKDALALYLMYNYSPTLTNKNSNLFGCSLVKSSFIYNNFYPKNRTRWKIPTFNDLHPKNGIPFFILVVDKCFKNYYKNEDLELKRYTSDEIISEEWLELDDIENTPTKGTVKSDVSSNSNSFLNKEESFESKFRMVINKE